MNLIKTLYIASFYFLMYPLIAYTLNQLADMEEKFLQREASRNSLQLPTAINDDNEGSSLVRRTTFDESRNVEH